MGDQLCLIIFSRIHRFFGFAQKPCFLVELVNDLGDIYKAYKLFGRTKILRTALRIGNAFIGNSADVEIYQANIVLRCQHNIGRLNIAVDNGRYLTVQIFYSGAKLQSIFAYLCFGKGSAFSDKLLEIFFLR